MDFVLFYMILSFVLSSVSSEKERHKVAVCVGGQVERWLPRYLFDDMILPNPEFDFHLFYNLQQSNFYHSSQESHVIYNTDVNFTYFPSPMSYMQRRESINFLWNLYNNQESQNLKHIELNYFPFINETELVHRFNFLSPPFVQIEQYKEQQVSILNMYYHQFECVEQIEEFSLMNNVTFQFIIVTREDIWFWKSLNLTELIPLFLPKRGAVSTGACDLLTKDCLSWGGLNMRMYIMPYEKGLTMLRTKFEYYSYLQSNNITYYNPEEFELGQTRHYHVRACARPLSKMPVTAVRHMSNFSICFPWKEYHKCNLPSKSKFLHNHYCHAP